MKLANGIYKNWSTVQKNLHKLSDLRFSHVTLVMGKDGDLLVYAPEGRYRNLLR